MRKNAEQWCAEMDATFRENYVDPLYEALDATESPIERVMLWALIDTCMGNNALGFQWAAFFPVDHLPGGDATAGAHCIGLGDDMSIVVNPPVEACGRKYRIDIGIDHALRNGSRSWGRVHIAVECDGHEFHERTKEQAEYDKRRDRDLQAIGWHVARFTGSEIIRDPRAAAQKVWDFSNALTRTQVERVEAIAARSSANVAGEE